jgi:hypothetical protein
MKKTIISLVSACALLLAGALCAQAQTEHLTFKGIPIDGTIKTMVAKLQDKGYKVLGVETEIGMLEGDFAGYSGCTIGVMGSAGMVTNVIVLFPKCDTWSALYSNYLSLRDSLTDKYGVPESKVEIFESASEPESDWERMYEVKNKRCLYRTTYALPNGKISISIGSSNYDAYVAIAYVDSANMNTNKSKASEDL